MRVDLKNLMVVCAHGNQEKDVFSVKEERSPLIVEKSSVKEERAPSIVEKSPFIILE